MVYYERGVVPPRRFLSDPFGCFERGVLVKESTRDLKQSWTRSGEKVLAFAKLVKPNKSQVGKSGLPLYEYLILKLLEYLGLPGARPLGWVEKDGQYMIVMERLPGFRTIDPSCEEIFFGLSEFGAQILRWKIMCKIFRLRIIFRFYGIKRRWHLKDMVIRLEEGKLFVVPTDWERTKIKRRI